MDLKELKAAVGKPQIAMLKQVGKGVKLGLVLGDRVLVKPIIPYTEMDEIEKNGLLYMPETVKSANTPLPSTGIVVALGEECSEKTQERLSEGTGVLFGKYAGTDIVIDGGEFKVFNTADIMCTFIDSEETTALIGEWLDDVQQEGV